MTSTVRGRGQGSGLGLSPGSRKGARAYDIDSPCQEGPCITSTVRVLVSARGRGGACACLGWLVDILRAETLTVYPLFVYVSRFL